MKIALYLISMQNLIEATCKSFQLYSKKLFIQGRARRELVSSPNEEALGENQECFALKLDLCLNPCSVPKKQFG